MPIRQLAIAARDCSRIDCNCFRPKRTGAVRATRQPEYRAARQPDDTVADKPVKNGDTRPRNCDHSRSDTRTPTCDRSLRLRCR